MTAKLNMLKIALLSFTLLTIGFIGNIEAAEQEAIRFGSVAMDIPAVMHIRHTERPKSTQESREYAKKTGKAILKSTAKGKQAAFEFGVNLPSKRVYRVYHSSVTRAIETAEQIHKGLLSQGAESHLKGVFMNVHYNQGRSLEYLQRDVHDVGASTARPYFVNYVSEHYPPWKIEPGSLVAQRHAAKMSENLTSGTSETFDLYVSHDVFCALFLFYWFGIMPDERWIEFLDGFLVQLSEERMHVYTKDGKKEAYYPYWWNF